jgi:hypothetical protein
MASQNLPYKYGVLAYGSWHIICHSVEGFGNTAREVPLIGWSSITRVFRVHKLIDILI